MIMENSKNNIEESIYKKMIKISNNNNDLLYSSFHYDKFNKLNASRNTLARFKEFRINNDLTGYKIFDFGSNIGEMSFEFIRRKAFVHGFEKCPEKINVCKELAKYLDVEKIMSIYEYRF